VAGKPGQRKLAGTINWFSAFQHGKTADVRNVSFDITDAVKALDVGTSGLTVVFQASEGVDLPAGETPAGAQEPRAAQESTARFNPAAKLTIGSIQIQKVSNPR
jgi:hypothetical protein